MRAWSRRFHLVVWFLLALCALSCSSPSDEARTHRERAQTYFDAGRYREASLEFQSALQKVPGDAEALYGLARCLDAMGQPKEYRAMLERVLRAEPDHPKACVELGGINWAAGRYEAALALSRKALGRDSSFVEARKLEARSLAALGRLDEARQAWTKVLESSPREESYVEVASFEVMAGAKEEAGKILAEGLGKWPKSSKLWRARADLLSLQGDWQGAEEALDKAEAASPGDPEVQVSRARFLVRKGEVEKGLALLADAQRSAAGDPAKSALLARRRADLLLQLGAVEPAEKVLREERERGSADPQIAASLAYLLLLQGKTDEARVLLPAARKADPTGRTARILEAWLYLLEGHSHWALQILQGLVARGDLAVDTHFLYARALADENRLAKAREEVEAVLRRVPDHFFARLDLVSILMRQREYQQALTQLDRIRKPWSDYPQARYLRARILLEMGETERARVLAKEFLERAPENPTLLTLMGDVERARGKPDLALKLYGQAAEKAPKALDPVLAQVSLLEKLDRQRDATAVAEDFMKVNGENPTLLNRVASMDLAMGDRTDARQRVERSLILEPNFWASRLLRARILLAAGDRNGAMVDLEEAINLNPYRPEAYNLLADLYKQRGEPAKAEETYRRLLDLVPDDPLTANNLAFLYLGQGKVDAGLTLAFKARAGAPQSPVVADTLGWGLDLAGRHEEAEPYLRQALQTLESNPFVCLHWGSNQAALGKREPAKKALQEVVRLAPDSAEAAQAKSTLEKLRGP